MKTIRECLLAIGYCVYIMDRGHFQSNFIRLLYKVWTIMRMPLLSKILFNCGSTSAHSIRSRPQESFGTANSVKRFWIMNCFNCMSAACKACIVGFS